MGWWSSLSILLVADQTVECVVVYRSKRPLYVALFAVDSEVGPLADLVGITAVGLSLAEMRFHDQQLDRNVVDNG